MTPSLASSYGSCCISRLGKRLKLQFTHRGSGKTMEKMLEIEKKKMGNMGKNPWKFDGQPFFRKLPQLP
jgi:hypothetical protein